MYFPEKPLTRSSPASSIAAVGPRPQQEATLSLPPSRKMSFTQDAYTYAGKPSREQGGYLPHKRYPVPGAQLTNGAAGISTGRVTELSLHTRKRTDWTQKDGRLFRELTEPGHPPPAPHALKKSQLRYCGLHPEEQRMHFQTRWKPVDGKMAFCTGRRGGSATVECDYEFIDRQQTYHTWKRMGNSQPHKESHLQVGCRSLCAAD